MPDLSDQTSHHVNLITNTQQCRHAILIPSYIEVEDKAVEVKGLINIGAEAIIINSKLVDQYNLPTVRLPRALTFHNVDDSMNKKGNITH